MMFTSMLKKIEEEIGIKVWHRDHQQEPDHWEICFDTHCKFSKKDLPSEYKGVMVIRDPRDIIISGMHYHMISDEEWLRIPQPWLNGGIYQKMLVDLTTDEERYLYEMKYAATGTINEIMNAMRSFPEFHASFHEE